MKREKKTYRAEFYTGSFWSSLEVEAYWPKQALELARKFYDEHPERLEFENHGLPDDLAKIEIWDEDRRTRATWESEFYRQSQAASDLLAALELCVDCLAELSRLDDGTPSVSAFDQARAAIAKAKGDEP